MVDFGLIKSVAFKVNRIVHIVAICFFVTAFQVLPQNGLLRTDQPLRHTVAR
jgi:hypothetical protein